MIVRDDHYKRRRSENLEGLLFGIVMPATIIAVIGTAFGYFSCYAGAEKKMMLQELRRKITVVNQVHITDGTVNDKTYVPSVDINLEGGTSFSGTDRGMGAGLGLGIGSFGAGVGVGIGTFQGSGHTILAGSTSDEPRVGISCDKPSVCCPGYTILTDRRSWATLQEGERVTLTFTEIEDKTYHDQNRDYQYSPGEKVLGSERRCRLNGVRHKDRPDSYYTTPSPP